MCIECRVDSYYFHSKKLVIIAKKKGQEEERCFSYIKSISSMGLMEIEFSEKMNTNLTINKLNITYIDIFITPYISLETEYKDVNLTWEVISFKNTTLLVQLNFSNPLMISNNIKYDNITVHVINFTDIFVSDRGLKLNYNSKNMTSKIKK